MWGTEFKYIDRDHRDSAVLIPGWATDYRIFDSLDLKFNYLLPTDFLPFDFESRLLDALKANNIKKISLLGFSLGGFTAVEFALENPDLIHNLILVGIRKRFTGEELDKVKDCLVKDKRVYLSRFYSACFSEESEIEWFNEHLFEDYCAKFDLDHLLKTLDYLGSREITTDMLRGIKNVKIVHGGCDRITPIEEAIDIKRDLPNADFIEIKNSGHVPFFTKGFNDFI